MAYVTHRDIQRAFWQMCQACGFTVAEQPTQVGAYQLNRNGGGWVVEKIENDAGAVSHPFGNDRYSSANFIRMLFFATDVARHATPSVKVVVVKDQEGDVSDVYVYRDRYDEAACIADAEHDQMLSILEDELVLEGDREAARAFLDEFATFTCKTDTVRDL